MRQGEVVVGGSVDDVVVMVATAATDGGIKTEASESGSSVSAEPERSASPGGSVDSASAGQNAPQKAARQCAVLPTEAGQATMGGESSEDDDPWLHPVPRVLTEAWRKNFMRRSTCGMLNLDQPQALAYRLCYSLSGLDYKRGFTIASVPAMLWTFFLGLKVLGAGFNFLGAKESGRMFDGVGNSFGGLCAGILVTVLMQSSSSSTSMIVTAVASGELSLNFAIAMVMGANIGTSVTNTMVAMANAKKPADLRRAMECATVHDLFNYLTVLILLPLQANTHFLTHITDDLTQDVVSCEADCDAWKNPVSKSVSTVAKSFASVDKDVLKEIAANNCAGNATRCDDPLLKGGLLYNYGMSDAAAGWVCTASSILVLVGCLYGVVKSMRSLMPGTLASMLRKSLDYNGYVTMMIGCGLTILVQSSSITTATLTPLCATGLIKLKEMFPATLGANLGTTVTGLLAAAVATSNAKPALQTAYAHVLFNVIGIAIWYPAPFMRRIPLDMAKRIGEISERAPWFPIAYTLSAFVAFPLLGYALTNALTTPSNGEVSEESDVNATDARFLQQAALASSP